MKRVTGCEYKSGSDIPTLLMVDGVDINNINKSYSFERVVHAHWIAMGDRGVTRCSHCGWNIEECINYKRCPECGAHMDTEREEK